MLFKVLNGDQKVFKTGDPKSDRLIELLYQYDELDEMNEAHDEIISIIDKEILKLTTEIENQKKFLPVDNFIELMNSMKNYHTYINKSLGTIYSNDLRYIHDTLLNKYLKKERFNNLFFEFVTSRLLSGGRSSLAAEKDYDNILTTLSKWGQENPKIDKNLKDQLIYEPELSFKKAYRYMEKYDRSALSDLIEYMFYFYKENTIKNCLMEHSLADLLNYEENRGFDLPSKTTYLYLANKLRDVMGLPDKK